MSFGGGNSGNRALTLLELIVTIVIIGILSSIAMPTFTKMMETTRAKEARTALQQIRTAERIYHSGESTYLPLPLGTVEDDIAVINTELNIFLPAGANRHWDYSVEAPTADTFNAVATRTSGRNQNETISIDQTGNLDETGWTP
jgi:prepilin-type N-terminal cleavage/methylation domain-containing protein